MSNLLSQASLVMIPSGYKEDVVYSAIPTNGNGDLSFTRASNGTRVNSAGLVEVAPWNLATYSEQFTNAIYTPKNGTFTDNFAVAPNGTTTAAKWEATDSDPYIYQAFNGVNVDYTATCWIKATGTAIGKNCSIRISGDLAVTTMTGEWQQLTITANINGSENVGVEAPESATSGEIVYIWGFQLNIGSTAKPYFPTTDRLNVPRLTYQNGGGGCPSLLLEKQSTNLLSYSQDFTNVYWNKTNVGIGDVAVVTANYAISPDGTQNATRFVCNLNGGTTASTRSWMLANFTPQATVTISIWIKLNSAGTKTIVFSDSGGQTKTISGTDWQRVDTSVSGAAGEFRIGLVGGSSSDTLDCCIWGAQAEGSSYVTSYIPTTSSSATRVADACFKTGISSLIGQTEGVVFLDWIMLRESLGVTEDYYTITLNNGTGNTLFAINNYDNRVRFHYYISGSLIFSNTSFEATSGQRLKMAFAYKQNDFAVYVNGNQIATSSSVNVAGMSGLTIGCYVFENYNDNIQVNQAALFKTRLTNAELASLTTI